MALEYEKLKKEAGARDDFKDCALTIDHTVCRLGECKLCIQNCPTKALYQQDKVTIIHELCTGCGSCILLCMVPGCMKLARTRIETGAREVLSTPIAVGKSVGAENKRKLQAIVRSEIEPEMKPAKR